MITTSNKREKRSVRDTLEFDVYFKALSFEAKEVLSVATTRGTVLIALYSTHSLSRRSRVLPKAQRYVLVTTTQLVITQLVITELVSQRKALQKAAKLAAKVDVARSVE